METKKQPEPMKFRLEYKTEERHIAHCFDGPHLSDVLEAIEDFIRACGFCPGGKLDFVNDEVRP